MRVRATDGSPAHARLARSATPRHIRGGRLARSWDQESILELQRLAGNAAVARSLIGQQRNGRVVAGVDTIKLREKPSPPPGGMKSFRDLANGRAIMGYTIREISDNPPILKPESPSQTGEGWTVKARPVNYFGEPKFEEYWPTTGRHKLAEFNYMDIDDKWEKKLHQGEDEHVSDTTLAWELTWKLVADTINRLAKAPGPPQPTADEARRNLFERYRRALREPDLRPEGAEPDENAQRKVLAVEDGTLFWWLFQTTVVRDTRSYHLPKTDHKFEDKDTISHLEDGGSQIPGPKSPELLKEVRKKFRPGEIIKGTERMRR